MIDKPFFAVRCAPCYGTGFVDQDAACSVCKGNGLIPLEGTAEDYMDCPGCGGAGFCGFDQHDICKRCDGVGAVKRPPKTGKRW
jgi:DnaJ-class molecular chaperone